MLLDIANNALREFAEWQRDAWAGLLAALAPETPSDPPADPVDPDPPEEETPPVEEPEPAPTPAELTLTHLGTVRLFVIGDTLWIGRDQVVKYGLEYANNLQAYRIGWE